MSRDYMAIKLANHKILNDVISIANILRGLINKNILKLTNYQYHYFPK